MTNGDKIRKMTDEELVELLASQGFCDLCTEGNICDGKCDKFLGGWIKKEAEPRKLIYISHPCTSIGDIDENYKNAKRMAEKYKSQGYHVLNPLAVINPDTDHAEAMEISLKLLKICDGIAMCGNWQNSKGCKAELEYAKEKGIEVIKESVTSNACVSCGRETPEGRQVCWRCENADSL